MGPVRSAPYWDTRRLSRWALENRNRINGRLLLNNAPGVDRMTTGDLLDVAEVLYLDELERRAAAGVSGDDLPQLPQPDPAIWLRVGTKGNVRVEVPEWMVTGVNPDEWEDSGFQPDDDGGDLL